MFSFQTFTYQYPTIISMMMYTITSPSLSNIMRKLDNGSASLMIALLSSIISLQSLIFYLPSDLKTSTIVIDDV